MNQEQAKEWLPLIQAIADGKTIQVKPFSGKWQDCKMDFSVDTIERIAVDRFRIKPEPKKIDVNIALYFDDKSGSYWCEAIGHKSLNAYRSAEQCKSFVKWLDHLEYELPEEEA